MLNKHLLFYQFTKADINFEAFKTKQDWLSVSVNQQLRISLELVFGAAIT